MFDRLASQFPGCDQNQLSALAAVWSDELERIVSRVVEIGTKSGRLPLDASHEAISELANLALWLEDCVVAAKTRNTAIETIDPVAEARHANSAAGLERIENTARQCAEKLWKPLQERWWQKYPAIQNGFPPTKVSLGRGPAAPGARLQHFSPVFSNKLWASVDRKEVRVYSVGVDHRIVSSDVGYRLWGREAFMYSQDLEHRFGLVEGDARGPYMKLLRVEPFSERDRRHWVAFLATQMFRTPWFVIQNLPRLKQTIIKRGLDYPTDVASLRRAYETLFTNDDVFATTYKMIVGRKWELWRPPSTSQFVRSDNPVVVRRGRGGGTTVFYPISPDACFVAGPEPATGALQVVPERRQLDEREAADLNRRMALAARHTAIARPVEDDSKLKAELGSCLGRRWLELASANDFLPEYWGDLA